MRHAQDVLALFRSVSWPNRVLLLPLVLYAWGWAWKTSAIRYMRSLTVVFLLASAGSASADIIYSYVGDTFHTVSGNYTLEDRISGSLRVADTWQLPGENHVMPEWGPGLLAWNFTDSHNVFTEANSTPAEHFSLGALPEAGFGAPSAAGAGWFLGFSADFGTLTSIQRGDRGDLAISSSGWGGNTCTTICNDGSGWGTWTVERTTVSTPELAILPHLPRLLKWGLGLGLEARVTNMLQHATAWTAATILRAPRDGVFIDLPHARIEVAEACSGIATLAFMLGVAGLMAAVRCSWCGNGFGPNETPVREKNPTVVDVYHEVCLSKLRRAEKRIARKLIRALNAAVFVDKRTIKRTTMILALFLAAALLALEANALRVVLIALGGEHRDSIQYATTALAVGQLVWLGRAWR